MPTDKQQTNTIQNIHKRKYLASIVLLPELHQQKVKEYFQISITFIALIVAVVFAIEPTLTTISQLNKQLSDAKQVSTELQTKITDLSQLNVQYNTLQPILPKIYDAIPQTEEAQLFLAQLQALASQDHIKITVLTAQAEAVPQPTSAANDILLTLTGNGTYTNIRTFIQDSISFQRIVFPTQITITNSLDSNNLTLFMTGKAYFTQ